MCKFTPMEFETAANLSECNARIGVNLLRWSLKRARIYKDSVGKGVNLLQWSLKLDNLTNLWNSIECKFTPMEFETLISIGLTYLAWV